MTGHGWATLAVIALTILVLFRSKWGADVVVVAAVSLLVFMGVLTPSEALSGMSNQGMITVAVLYVVVCGLTETGAVRWIGSRLLGRPTSALAATARLCLPVTAVSGFVNNTPLVAMLIPAVQDWCRRMGFSPSRFMIPLSYAAILGGTCTLIGTSTNLVVSGEWIDSGEEPLALFEIAKLGVPVALTGLLYIVFVLPRFLPERRGVLTFNEDPRSYTVEMTVAPGGPLVGQSIEDAGLRHLPGVFLAELERQGRTYPAVAPEEKLEAEDRLVFVGVVDSVVDLQRIRGLEPATDQVVKLNEPRPKRCLVEASISNTSPLVGQTVRAGRFRSVYNAVVIAVARGGERVSGKIGDIELQVGDTLLLEAPRSFVEQHKNSRDFFLMSEVADSTPVRHEKAILAVGIVALMVAIATLQPVLPLPTVWGGDLKLGMLHAAVLAAGLMLVLRCCWAWQARQSVDWRVLVVIAGSLALGKAMDVSGAANWLGEGLISVAGGNPYVTIALIYLTTMLLTEMITNNAAAVLMFFVAKSAADQLGVEFMPLVMTIMMAASASFSTPLGYQTNLMVLGPGGYRFGDYLRAGLPLNLLAMTLSVVLAPMIWPLTP